MAKKLYVGVNGIARQVNNIYVGVNGVARKVIKGYVGVGGVARLFYELITSGTTTLWSGQQGNISGGIQTVSCVNYANGYWVVGGTYYDGTNVYARIAYTNDLNGSWTFKDLWSTERSGINGYASVNFIDYVNGYWIAAGEYEKIVQSGGITSYPNFAQIAYGSDLSEEWTLKVLWNSGNIVGGKYNGSTLALFGYYETDQMWQVVYASSPEQEWTIRSIVGEAGTQIQVYDLTYGNNNWFFSLRVSSTSSYTAYVYIFDENFNTHFSRMLESGSEGSEPYCIFYDNNSNILAVGSFYSDEGNYDNKIYYSNNDDYTNWNEKTITNSPGTILNMTYDGNNWIIVGGNRGLGNNSGFIGFSSQIDGDWAINNISLNFRTVNDIIYANGIYLAGGSNIVDSTNSVLVTYSNQINNLGQN